MENVSQSRNIKDFGFLVYILIVMGNNPGNLCNNGQDSIFILIVPGSMG